MKNSEIVAKFEKASEKTSQENPLYDLAMSSSGIRWGVSDSEQKNKEFYEDKVIIMILLIKKHEKFLKTCFKLAKEINE